MNNLLPKVVVRVLMVAGVRKGVRAYYAAGNTANSRIWSPEARWCGIVRRLRTRNFGGSTAKVVVAQDPVVCFVCRYDAGSGVSVAGRAWYFGAESYGVGWEDVGVVFDGYS